MNYIFYSAAGVFGGILGGMGMGGGTVLIPLLSVVLGAEQRLAQAINLISFVPMAVIALIIHAKNGLIKAEGLWVIIACGLLSCAGGCFIAGKIQSETLKKIFGGFLVILSIIQAIVAVRRKRDER